MVSISRVSVLCNAMCEYDSLSQPYGGDAQDSVTKASTNEPYGRKGS